MNSLTWGCIESPCEKLTEMIWYVFLVRKFKIVLSKLIWVLILNCVIFSTLFNILRVAFVLLHKFFPVIFFFTFTYDPLQFIFIFLYWFSASYVWVFIKHLYRKFFFLCVCDPSLSFLFVFTIHNFAVFNHLIYLFSKLHSLIMGWFRSEQNHALNSGLSEPEMFLSVDAGSWWRVTEGSECKCTPHFEFLRVKNVDCCL